MSSAPARPPGAEVWPHSAQLAAAFLVGGATALLAVYAYGSRFGGQPAALERGALAAYRVDLNQASRAEIQQLPGVGQALARRIDDYRLVHGGFRNVNELSQVHGVGPTMVERLRPWVHVRAEPDPQPSSSSRKPAKPGGAKIDKLRDPVAVNHASAEELQRLPGIGPKLAQRILDERGKKPFRTVDDLRRVSGIGPRILERLRPFVLVTPVEDRLAASDQS